MNFGSVFCFQVRVLKQALTLPENKKPETFVSGFLRGESRITAVIPEGGLLQ